MVWRGVSAYRGPAISTGENSETWGHGSRFGILDIGGGKFTWYATANAERRSGVPREWLRERFAGWHEPIPELIESAELILEHGAYDLPALPRWTVGRVTLLGDAAHACTPNLGQGDAWRWRTRWCWRSVWLAILRPDCIGMSGCGGDGRGAFSSGRCGWGR